MRRIGKCEEIHTKQEMTSGRGPKEALIATKDQSATSHGYEELSGSANHMRRVKTCSDKRRRQKRINSIINITLD